MISYLSFAKTYTWNNHFVSSFKILKVMLCSSVLTVLDLGPMGTWSVIVAIIVGSQ